MADEVRLMRNGFTGSAMVKGPNGVMLTGMTEDYSREFAKRRANTLGVPFVDELARVDTKAEGGG